MTEPWRTPISREHEEEKELAGAGGGGGGQGELGRSKPLEPVKPQRTKGIIKILRH